MLNRAIEMQGYPIRIAVRRIDDPIVRCDGGQDASTVELRTSREIL